MRTFLLAALVSCAGTSLVSAPGNGPTASPCYLTLHVPVGATLTVNGVRTGQMTAVRRFVSPALPIGPSFYYIFEATFTWNGEVVGRRKQVEVKAGGHVIVDMMTGEVIKAAVAKPAASPTPFETPKVEKKADAPKKPAKPEIEVPYVPTPEDVVKEMLKMAAVKKGDTVYDLGCGDGRIVLAAVKDFQAKKGLGIDFNPERVKDSEANAKAAGKAVQDKLTFKQGDVLKMTAKDFEGVDVVTLYLLPEVNLKLKPVLLKGLKPGARIVSHDFDMGDWKPEKTSTITDSEGTEHTIYLWTVPKNK